MTTALLGFKRINMLTKMRILKILDYRYFSTFMLVFLFCQYNVTAVVNVSEFAKLRQDYKVVSPYPTKLAKSLLDCSQLCAHLPKVCGLNFHKAEKTCRCFFETDVSPVEFLPETGSAAYARKDCDTYNQISGAPPTSSTNQAGTTTSSLVSSVTSSTASISISNSSKCFADALLCLSDKIYLFDGMHLRTYSNMNGITTGPVATQTVSSVFNGTSRAIAAYANTSMYFIFTESSVSLYSKADFKFSRNQTWKHHFGSDAIQAIDDVIYTTEQDRLIFSGDELCTISKNGQIAITSLENSGVQNRYRSLNYQDRPKNVTAACEITSDIHLFVSDGALYQFSFSDTKWRILGQVLC